MKIIVAVMMSILLSGCDVPKPLEDIVESMKNLMGMSPAKKPVSSQPGSSASPAPSLSAAASTNAANAELLTEMFKVTFNQNEIEDQSLFSSLVSSLNQGASLEGIYRGLVMGAKYRVLESKAKAASPDAIKFFASEMGALQMGMKAPTIFTKDTAKQAPSIDFPEGSPDNAPSVGANGPDSYTFGDTPKKDEPSEHQTPSSEKRSEKEIASEMLQDFIGATPFTLKRVLADEVMKKIDEMKDSPTDLAPWYASFVVRMSETNTDFGLPQRNTGDYDFHFRFAKTMSVDRVKWEVLNRYHRVINRLD